MQLSIIVIVTAQLYLQLHHKTALQKTNDRLFAGEKRKFIKVFLWFSALMNIMLGRSQVLFNE